VNRALTGAVVVAALLGVSAGAWAQSLDVDPCRDETGRALDACWTREAQRADAEMDRTYAALRDKLPSRAASSLEKAQKLWRKFRDAQVSTLYREENPRSVWSPQSSTCASIARYVMAQARTRELRRMLEPDPDSVCPL
jgi:uncharacterized protein YecT (DUF1311 family)